MFNIDQSAEDCNRNLPVNTQNNAAFNGSVSDGKIPVSGGEKEKDKVHGFSKKLAKLKNSNGKPLGWKAALILRYLAAASRKYGVTIDGKRWVRLNLDHISEQYPYLGRSTVDDNILRLEQFGCLEKQNGVPQLKRRKNDRTRCYHIPRQWMNAVEEEPRYFRTRMATRFNVPTAVIHYNFCYWLGECEKRKVERRVKLSPAVLVDLLPFSESTIKRSLETLEAEKYLHPVPGKISWYAEETQKVRGSNPDRKGPNPDEEGPNPDDKGSKPDNYIYCNSIIGELKKDSKTKPAASVLVNSDDVITTNDETNDLLNDGMIPCADEQDREALENGEIISADGESLISSLEQSEPGQITASCSEILNLEPGKTLSPFETCVSIKELNNPSVVSSTANIPDEVEHEDSRWRVVKSLEDLHQINHDNFATVEDLVCQPGGYQKFRDTVLNICAKTMTLIPQEISDDLYEHSDGDEILNTLLPYYHEFLDQTHLDPASELSNILYYGALECMIGAFLWPREKRDSYNHPLHLLVGITYEVYLVLWRRAENLRLGAIDEEFKQRREEFASRDEGKENDASLSPAEKTRIFRNALNSRNEVGWITFEQKLKINLIQVSKTGLQRIQRLFELNHDLTPAALLLVMDGCTSAYISRPAPPKKFVRGVQWHARMGHRLHEFASYLSTIVKQLGVLSPISVYLSDDKPEEDEVALAA